MFWHSFPYALVQHHSPPKAGSLRTGGAARSVSPIGRNLKICSKARSDLMNVCEAIRMQNRCASRISIRSALCADFEQTAPPLRGTPPNF